MKTRVLFATGYEEVEALTVVDIIRRAGITCSMVAADDADTVTGSHGIEVAMDERLSDMADECDMVILPGGMPGVPNLAANPKVRAMVKAQYDRGAWVAAICAAPTALGEFGILEGKRATCYPGMESGLTGACVCTEPVVVDGNVVTSRGLGTAIEFGLTLVSLLKDKKTADDLAAKIVYTR